MIPVAAIATGAGLLAGALRKKKKGPNRKAIVDRYRASSPKGFTTPEDEAAAARTQTRIAAAAQAVAKRRRAQNEGQVTARGLSGPAAAALEQQATDVEAQGGEEAARTSADQMYKAFQSNLGYERQKNDTAFASELGIATQDAARADAQNAGFWNSALEAVKGVAPLLGSLGGGTGATAGQIVGQGILSDPSMLSTGNPDIKPRAMTPEYR